MALQVLHPDVVRELLRGHESRSDQLRKIDVERRTEISKLRCPHPGCEEFLAPRVPQDPSRVFDEDGVRYEKFCPRHGRLT